MIDLDNKVDFDIDLQLVETITKELTNKEVELIITNNKEIQELNKEHRQKDKPTDVLSFPLEFDMPSMPLGSIVISKDFVEEKAKEYNHSFHDEFALLYIHGLLHLLGYDHEIDNGEQRQKEEELITKYNLPKSLIIRNS
ncbi:rRNA maturation RNase YbeY [Malaciobacter mytili]|uniref:Endoribonuclease YbeY n=1 Tax=Malaciobacter mytili LMG 24559 TaxID=1032238 RepID=A0AAX2ACG1_9BACT|nr:rRNA maturation RNase YbeY [Malaciobacter mytili]AXH15413.1 rRNA maturation RNase [Malaciobacter mytili LMG 24559]RXI45795.1 rRNA maturation RNase YbeY [Malaciobacter mytili]RXK14709.1 rRNA maturation RNase YbeY [Malaciobacter mytili LMG 24559]